MNDNKPVCEHNPSIDCPCPKNCPRHGKCCACAAHHREHGKLPACLRKSAFPYLDNAPVSATVCDREGIVLYQNATSLSREGDVRGKNLYGCHSPKTQAMIREMMEAGLSNHYQTVRQGKKRCIHQIPWYETPGGPVSGLIEMVYDLPEVVPVLNRD